MDSINPYESPTTIAPELLYRDMESMGGAWRSGSLLVVASKAELPERCVKCNQPASGLIKRFRLAWYPPLVYLSLVLGLIPFVILVLVLQHKMTVHAGVCPVCRSKRRRTMLVSWLGSIGGLILAIYAISVNGGWLIGIGVALFLISLVYGVLASRIIWPKRIKDNLAWLNGAGPDFLSTLPEFDRLGAP